MYYKLIKMLPTVKISTLVNILSETKTTIKNNIMS